ncbi:coiled-coil domain-containing protein [Flavobacterium kingsejongi]|uniref:Uncharacterized protein n=1 Tax=Flavobacterium kingsejongi TaxID=1678728 RepID=A0A2S1LP99_9FLAO|nr:hypothetical protein [Flavobacterium kingsejongi]AWG25590.1 hypothetical protein FK004_10285 [Flavobacterium kingsejongi]
MSKILSSEIVSLVHHVKLNESGWWEKAIQNIIISTFGINNNEPISDKQIFDNLITEIKTEIDIVRLLKQFETLKSKGIIVNAPGNLYVLSNEKYEEFNSSFTSQKEIELEAENRFKELCTKVCPEIGEKKLWGDLNDYLVIPLIKEIGAKTYELISGVDSKNIAEYGQFHNFLSRFNGERDKIQILLLQYFDFSNDFVKKYILHQLNAYFFIEATNLNQKTVEEVYALSKSQSNLKIFVDTNFLLTLLDLHDNPSNDAGFALLELIEEIKNKVVIKFYVLPKTVEEFQNLIKKFKDHIKKLKPTLNQAIAAEGTEEFTGIVKKYFQKCHEKNVILDLDDYFDPYLDNFSVNIRKKGIEIQQDNMDKYTSDQRVIDDLLQQADYRYDRYANNGKFQGLNEEEKKIKKDIIYDKFNHDCQIWYYVKDKRPAYIDSTKDVSSWILTLDYSFLEYDKFKQNNDTNIKISICLHPNEFISMLQFWVPRTEKFENAILGSFRLPFFFKEVDSESEKISMDTLRAMTQYEDNNKFSSELVTEILTNKALRQKIKPNNSVEQNAELLKDEIFKSYELKKEQLILETEKKNELSDKLTSVESVVQTLSKKIDELQEKTNVKIEKELELIRQSRIQEITNSKNILNYQKEQLELRINDFEELIRNADDEINLYLNSLSSQIQSFFVGKVKYEEETKNKIYKKYYDTIKFNTLKLEHLETIKKLENLDIPSNEGKIIIYCENQNAHLFNKLSFHNIHFIPETNSNGVYIKVQANPTHFGVRDRDYLTDNEVIKLKKLHKNYFILDYYCFENYLYHPDNLVELELDNFNKDLYINELIIQKESKYDSIVAKLINSRNSYQEFKLPDVKIREKNDLIICENLKSDELEIFLKSFSLKTEFDRTFLSKYQLKDENLIKTEWFRDRIEKLLSFTQ